MELFPGLTQSMSFFFYKAMDNVVSYHHEFLMPEHLLLSIIDHPEVVRIMRRMKIDQKSMRQELDAWLKQQERIPKEFSHVKPEPSVLFKAMHSSAYLVNLAGGAGVKLNVTHFLTAMLTLPYTEAPFLIDKYIGEQGEKFTRLVGEKFPDEEDPEMKELSKFSPLLANESEGGLSDEELMNEMRAFIESGSSDFDDDDEDGDDGDFWYDDDDDNDEDDGIDNDEYDDPEGWQTGKRHPSDWHKLVTCISDKVDQHNPLIGREKELDRTIQVLCRAEKNNPLHVGEPGVGKTALVFGLAKLINENQVPDRLKGARIYGMDIGQMLAGSQYRGDFEKRIKMVMDGAAKEGNVIIYIDEIHNMIGAGRGSDGGPDASNMLKQYLEAGDIRFIGSTTYEEYNRYMAKSKGIVRRFQQIDIKEPSVDEAIKILEGLQHKYNIYHGVTYRKDALEYAVRASDKYISNRFLPDKAIDLMDEAGAYLEVHPANRQRSYVTKAVIQQILTKVCKIDAAAIKDEDNSALASLRQRMLDKIYGQDTAVDKVVEAVMMAKAGLIDDDKPMASLLFVGPTGVGKTEVARVLARELGIELVRFDMSEYTEKHAVAKLIGSPAGYVGYEDGGQLTDAIRKTPNCVLLLDEIEKAHSDIYNILLQVMDYARLTDNKGQKADFRNVILIMTSNAGAQYASQANIGFAGNVSRGQAMLAQVKKTFRPEFINRLSDTVVFHDMDRHMAELILDKKLAQLADKLSAKGVSIELTPQTREQLLKWGFTKEYGAREMDRVIGNRLKPVLMKALLFGKLKKGGKAVVKLEGKELVI
ncbi:AAA domain-containing protein [Prevotella copri]|uniref:AAA domain-containing protein n=1 Tax=Segatella copri TaxID=165179 RepID=A0A6A7WC61_9BACT|nr:AAA family ATPase [Segatella copri]MQP12073.1 AAA domain-containing protein [Segatella copri]